jgi:hypothetical protein
MAIVVIGGLVTSTFLSLLVIPVLYEVVDDLVQRCTPKRRQAPTELQFPAAPESDLSR